MLRIHRQDSIFHPLPEQQRDVREIVSRRTRLAGFGRSVELQPPKVSELPEPSVSERHRTESEVHVVGVESQFADTAAAARPVRCSIPSNWEYVSALLRALAIGQPVRRAVDDVGASQRPFAVTERLRVAQPRVMPMAFRDGTPQVMHFQGSPFGNVAPSVLIRMI